MPDFARIEPKSDSAQQSQLLGYIRQIQVEGANVYGEYGSLFSENASPDAGEHGYFILDTHDGTVRNFDTLKQLNGFVGHQVNLIKCSQFHSQESSHKLFLFIKRLVLFGPTIAASFIYFLFLMRMRTSGTAGSSAGRGSFGLQSAHE